MADESKTPISYDDSLSATLSRFQNDVTRKIARGNGSHKISNCANFPGLIFGHNFIFHVFNSISSGDKSQSHLVITSLIRLNFENQG